MRFVKLHSDLALLLWLSFHASCAEMATRAWWDRRTTRMPSFTRKPRAKLTASYFFPYMCSIIYLDQDFEQNFNKMGKWVSTCTILTPKWVTASLDNFNYQTPDTKYYFYHDMSKLRIHAGTIYGNPSKWAKGLRNIQRLSVDKFVTLNNANFTRGGRSRLFSVEGTPKWSNNLNRAALRTPLKMFQWDVAFLRTRGSFKWTAQVLPAPQFEESHFALAKKVSQFIHTLESSNNPGYCAVGGWDRFTSRLGFYDVKYIPKEECLATFCSYDSRACWEFPNPQIHVCFKSIDYGSDVCPEDRGSAVYCDKFGESVFAILTAAPNCGYKNLPGVYTLINHVLNAYEQIGSGEAIKRLSDSSLRSYTLSPAEFSWVQ